MGNVGRVGDVNSNAPVTLFQSVCKSFRGDYLALSGLAGIIVLSLIALFAPFIANSRPLVLYIGGELSFPFLRYIFAPDTTEIAVEKVFNYLLLFCPLFLIMRLLLKRVSVIYRRGILCFLALIVALPFFLVGPKLEKSNWRALESGLKGNEFAIFTPVPYGPFENVATAYEHGSWEHIFGTDQIGRDIFARMVYGARVSLAVGFFATGIAMIIGVVVGMFSAYYRGWVDILTMRMVEIIICFPTFLLLLILMSIFMDNKFQQSILLVIGVIGLTSWTGLSRLVRGEVLKQRVLPYIQNCEALGLPVHRIMFFHLLPNITGPILVNFTFGVAGAILAESGLSFLGFGVQDPTASWGELLRQAFADPLSYWHLTLWPGLAIFISVGAFNFMGEGLRKALDPKG